MKETLLRLLQDLHPDVDFEDCETLIDDGILNSLDIVTLITDLSSEFDITVPPEEILPENFNSLKDMLLLLTRLCEE